MAGREAENTRVRPSEYWLERTGGGTVFFLSPDAFTTSRTRATTRRMRRLAGFERGGASAAAADQPAGNVKGGLVVRADVPDARRLLRGPQQRNQTVGTPTAGGNLVATEHMAGSFIDVLRTQTAADVTRWAPRC